MEPLRPQEGGDYSASQRIPRGRGACAWTIAFLLGGQGQRVVLRTRRGSAPERSVQGLRRWESSTEGQSETQVSHCHDHRRKKGPKNVLEETGSSSVNTTPPGWYQSLMLLTA